METHGTQSLQKPLQTDPNIFLLYYWKGSLRLASTIVLGPWMPM